MKQIYLSQIAFSRQFVKSKCLQAIILILLGANFQAFGQVIEWNKVYGGSSSDILYSVQQTADGGYILGGSSSSPISGNKNDAEKGGTDYWIVKIGATGNKEWDKTFGGRSSDFFTVVQQTSDGGFIVGGSSQNDISGDKSEANRGTVTYDFWIIKLDAAGNKIWDKTIGGSNDETLTSIAQTSDGGYILGGESSSDISGEKTEPSKGLSDYWVAKVDAAGNKLWDRTFGGSQYDYLRNVIQKKDGGYVLAGESHSGVSGNKSVALSGESDFWVIMLDGDGNKTFEKAYGGNSQEWLFSVLELEAGGFILGGSSNSDISGDKSENSRGGYDYWLVKVDATGKKIWDRTYGGNSTDHLKSTKITKDGGFILGGYSLSGLSGEKSEASRGQADFWVVKVDAAGNKAWDKTIGGSGWDILEAITQTKDGSYVMGGQSPFGISGDKTEAGYGSTDFWVVKLHPEIPPLPPSACRVIDFEKDNTGLITSTFAIEGDVAIEARKRDENGVYASENHAAIFDSQAPTGDDADLYTTDWGNVLIINQDLGDVPNDNQWGGELILDFSAFGPVTMTSLKALDIDAYENNSWVYLYDGDGNELYKVQMQALGNNSKQEVNLGNTKGVMKMKVTLDGLGVAYEGSGAIDDIKFCIEEAAAPVGIVQISEVTVYPNPSVGKATLEFKLRAADDFVVNLYDLKGKLIKELKTGRAKAGELVRTEINTDGLRNGLYFARIVSSSGSETIKIMFKK